MKCCKGAEPYTEAYGYFGVSQQKSTLIRVLLFYPGGGTFTLLQWEYF